MMRLNPVQPPEKPRRSRKTEPVEPKTTGRRISLRLPVLPITLVLSLLVAILAAIVPVRRAVSVEPAKVLKGE